MKIKTSPERRIRQGDIFKDIEYIEHATVLAGQIEVSRIIFPLVIVLTQDCDLEQDEMFRWGAEKKPTQDKYLLSVIVAPLYNAEHVLDGDHLLDVNMKMQNIRSSKTGTDFLRKNQRPRYHFIGFPDGVPIVPSVIDFKHYFSVNVVHLRELLPTNFVCSVDSLHREDVLQRFASFMSRIALPETQS